MRKLKKFSDIFLYILLIIFHTTSATGFWYFSNKDFSEHNKYHLEQISSLNAVALRNKIESYANILYSLRAVMTQNENDTLNDWMLTTESLKTSERYKGINGIGYSEYVHKNDASNFEKNLIGEYSNFDDEYSKKLTVFPKTEDKNYILKYTTPLNKNVKGIGYNLATNRERVSAIQKTIDTGSVVATETLGLINDPKNEPSFIMFLAVYNENASVETIHQRRENLKGVVSVAIKIPALIEDALSGKDNNYEIRIKVFEIKKEDVTKNHVGGIPIYDNHENIGNNNIKSEVYIEIGTKEWEFEFFVSSDFMAVSHPLSDIVLFTLSFLFIGYAVIVVMYQREKRKRAEIRKK